MALSQLTAISPQHFYYHADGNGNVTALINSLQLMAGKYLYDPYGNLLSQAGPIASINLYRFSSKEWQQSSGLVYYLYRFYDPNLQRWENRDPQAQSGIPLINQYYSDPEFQQFEYYSGNNLFLFVYNNLLNLFDPNGLDIYVIRFRGGVKIFL